MIGLRRRPLQTGIIDDITGPAVDRMLDEAHPETAPPEIEFTLDETDPQPQQPAALPHLIDDRGSSLESIGRDFVGIAAPFARMVQRSAAATSPTGMHFNHDPIRSLPPGANAPIQPDMQADDPWANEEPLSPDMLRTAQSRANGIESGKLPGFADDDDGEAVASSAPLTMNKGGQNPFAVSPEDKQRMQQAERADRRGRIARGILSALGGVTQIGASLAGGSPIAALGQGLYGVGQGVPTNRVAQEQGRQDRNAQQATRYAAYEQQQAMAASERERHAQEMALRQRSAESNMALDQARIQQLSVSTQQAQNEIDAAGADSAAARNILAHFAAGLNDNSPAADELRAAIADPSFAGMSAQTAREVMARYAQLANRRGAGLIDNGGGGGGGSGTYGGGLPGVPIGGGGGGAPRGGGGPRPAPGAAAMPSPGTVDPVSGVPLPDFTQYGINVRNQDEYAIALDALRRASDRLDMNNPQARLAVATAVSAFQRNRGNQAAEQLRSAGDRLTADAANEYVRPNETEAFRMAANAAQRVHDDLYLRFASPLAAINDALEQIRNAPDAATRAARQAELMAAIHGNAAAGRLAGVGSLRSTIARMRNDYARPESGAAISASEWQLFDSILGTDSVFTSPETIRNALQESVERARTIERSRFASAPNPDAATRWYRGWRENRRALRDASRGGAR